MVQRESFTLYHDLRVRWGEVDPQSIVFNPHYYFYFDVAVTEYWRAIGLPYPEGIKRFGSDMVAVRSTAEFHGSARFDEVLSVGCRAARIGRSSLTMEFGIWRGEEHLTSGEKVYVNVDALTKRPAPLPREFIDLIEGYERTPPARAS